MIGYQHTLIMLAGAFGLLLGGVLIDVDHSGTWSCKWKGFWGMESNERCHRGLLHNPVLLMSMAVFFICLGIGMLVHYITDFPVIIK